MSRRVSFRCIAGLAGVACAFPLMAGKVYTSTYTASGWVVDANTITDPNDAWLSGGPQNTNANGLPDGAYYYQITDPSGKTLLSTDDISCRTTQVTNGVIYGLPVGAPACSHPDALSKGLPLVSNGGDPLLLMPYSLTPNGGGVYKLWLTPVGSWDNTCTITQGPATDSGGACSGKFGFANSSSNTDNFKIVCTPSSLEGSTLASPGSGYSVGDTGTVSGSTTSDPATYVIASISNGGVASYVITYTGSGYSTATSVATAATLGSGVGFTINITSVGGALCSGTAAPQSIISGEKFNDLNQNGYLDNSETGLANWEIDVTVGQTVTPVFTDVNGAWSVPLTPGVTFQACEVMQTGWYQSGPPNPLPNPLPSGFTVPAGATVSTVNNVNCWNDTVPATNLGGFNFGNYQLADLTVNKTATPAFTRTYLWSINKTVDKPQIDIPNGGSATFNYTVSVAETGFNDSLWAVNGTITVANPNLLVNFTGVAVVDLIDNNGTCGLTGGQNNGVSETIDANSSVIFNYTCTFASNPTGGTNTAKASWNQTTFPTKDASSTGTAPYSFGAPTTRTNQNVTVTDSVQGTLGTAGPATDTTPYYSNPFKYARAISGVAGACTAYPNIASITQTAQTSSQSVTVCVGVDLQVSKTAIANFTAAITKSVDKPKVNQPGGTITLNYTVNVTESLWTVTGAISVTNPNQWEDIVANVGDALSDTTGVCTVTGGASATILRNTTSHFNYTCGFAASPAAGSGTNMGTATWNSATYHTPDASASGPAAYAFTSLTVTDCWALKGGTPCTPTTLGTVGIPPGSATFTYAHMVNNAAPGTCQEYDNTATITQTTQTASASAIQCNTNIGALSMGFWKNSNGQGIIDKYCAPTAPGATSLYTFLTSLNPFKDLTSSTCTNEAKYVNTVIGAATCGGISCNPMLKAQMLATALDVYFSTPIAAGGGGNEIGAYNGLGASTPEIGTIAIDLSTTGSEDSRAEFGICTGTNAPVAGCTAGMLGTTIGQMLTYANYASVLLNGNPVSNAGGSVWYKQNKNSQTYAEGTYDEINNSIANIASSAGSPSF